MTLNPVDPVYHVQYSYDSLGRFSSVSSSVQSVSSVVDYSYLEGSSLISGYTNNSGLAVSYSFEESRNNKTQVLNRFGTNVISQFDYQYDALGRRTQRTDLRPLDPGLSTNIFAYNSRSELTSAQMSTNEYDYGYDSIGNREFSRERSQGAQKETSYLANNLNQYLSTVLTNLTPSTVSTNLLSYDADGNLLSDGTSTYTWDGENRLIQASNATMIVAFKYDHQGRRFEKTVNATNTTQFIYDGWNLLQELITQNSSLSTNSYVWGLDLSQSFQGAGGIGGLLATIKGGAGTPGTPYFPCFDANGNVTDYISTNGTVAAHYEYDAYGKTTAASGSMSGDFVFRFSTKYFDAETGLYYYGHRYYSSELGRWLSKDPIGISGGLNLYAFCGNDPVNLTDPFGLYEVINRELGGDESRSSYNPLSHTFISTDGGANTYGWGSEFDEDGNGLWSDKIDNDRDAARDAYKSGKYRSKDPSLDPYIKQAYENLKKSPGSKHKNGWIFNNCKSELRKLEREAKRLKREAEKNKKKCEE